MNLYLLVHQSRYTRISCAATGIPGFPPFRVDSHEMEESVPHELPCLVCPEDVDMTLTKCPNCGELLSCIFEVWRQDRAVKRPRAADGAQGNDGLRSVESKAKRVLCELEDFRAAKKNKDSEAPSLSVSLALLEGQPCPWQDMAGCAGVILATCRLRSDHVYLRCSNNDPLRLGSVPHLLCKWSFNWVKEVDPEFASVVLQRRQ